MNELLESYVNGNISHVQQRLINEPYSFSEFFNAYIELYNPSIEDIKLFVRRLVTYQ
jgi:hypothetical protein